MKRQGVKVFPDAPDIASLVSMTSSQNLIKAAASPNEKALVAAAAAASANSTDSPRPVGTE